VNRALTLLALGALVHYGYALAPEDMHPRLWNVAGSVGRVALLLALVWHIRERLVLTVAAWWACEEALVIGCNIAYLVAPWPVTGSACSGLLTMDYGKLGIAAVAVLLFTIRR
jgi:hypothetical protein